MLTTTGRVSTITRSATWRRYQIAGVRAQTERLPEHASQGTVCEDETPAKLLALTKTEVFEQSQNANTDHAALKTVHARRNRTEPTTPSNAGRRVLSKPSRAPRNRNRRLLQQNRAIADVARKFLKWLVHAAAGVRSKRAWSTWVTYCGQSCRAARQPRVGLRPCRRGFSTNARCRSFRGAGLRLVHDRRAAVAGVFHDLAFSDVDQRRPIGVAVPWHHATWCDRQLAETKFAEFLSIAGSLPKSIEPNVVSVTPTAGKLTGWRASAFILSAGQSPAKAAEVITRRSQEGRRIACCGGRRGRMG